jgi:hypothetical protein
MSGAAAALAAAAVRQLLAAQETRQPQRPAKGAMVVLAEGRQLEISPAVVAAALKLWGAMAVGRL